MHVAMAEESPPALEEVTLEENQIIFSEEVTPEEDDAILDVEEEKEPAKVPLEEQEPEEAPIAVAVEQIEEETKAPILQENTGISNAAIAKFFGISVSSVDKDEAFYRALYAYAGGPADPGVSKSFGMSVMRGPGGMPMTIQVPSNGTVMFDGAKHQAVHTSGSISTTIPMPPYYQVTFQATVTGRIPGVYGPVLSSVTVWDSVNSMDMTNFFDISVTGGSLTIDATGSLLMISMGNVEEELEHIGWYDLSLVLSPQAVINWMPMSSELCADMGATFNGVFHTGVYPVEIGWGIYVIEDGMDITQYFDHAFASVGTVTITPPSPKFLVTAQETYSFNIPYTGQPINNKVVNCIGPVGLEVSVQLKPLVQIANRGTYILTDSEYEIVGLTMTYYHSIDSPVYGTHDVSDSYELVLGPITVEIY